MESFLTKCCMLIVIALVLQIHGHKGCLEKERIALLAIKPFIINATFFDDDDYNRIVESWVDDRISDCCNWYGVECNTATGRVMNLSLSGLLNESPTILNFSLFQPFEQLQILDLSLNSFQGWVDNGDHDSFKSLEQLKMLNLGGNRFNSSILSYLTTTTSLTTLILYSNNLEDIGPKQGLANLRSLEYLDLGDNEMSGSLQNLGLANLTNLEFLNLGGNRINGSLHELGGGLANLTNLEFLDLRSNTISGSLQELGGGLANLTNLEFLDLRSNTISGSLQELGTCEWMNLIELDLSWNNFEGHLPACLKNLTNLRVLELSSNRLSGNIPSVFANLSSLQFLSLGDNNFQGLFSFSSLANLSKLEIFLISTKNSTLQVVETENYPQPPAYQLKILSLSNCNLRVIPSFLMYQQGLQYIDLSHNKLVGTFPTWLLLNNTILKGMYLKNNSLTGILHLLNFAHDLFELKISNNNFNGQLPENIGMIFPKLSDLNLSKNSFEGHIPSSMGEMKELMTLDLSSNNFSGELPKDFVSGCFSLEILRLSNNNFHGKFFPEFMNMSHLWSLHLDRNNFSGELQGGWLENSLLGYIDLSNNFFSGQIPHWIGNFSNLEALLMSNNLLEGGVPIQLSYNNLRFLDISENRLCGSMPSSFNLSSMEHLYMQKNALNGSIPNVFFRSSELLILDLRDNKFSGSIPKQIDDEILNLRFLLLGGNHLEGHIPHELCNLKKIRILDLSHNRLKGSVPSCLGNMPLWASEDEYNYRFSTSGSLSSTNNLGTFYNFTLGLEISIEEFKEKNKELEVNFVSKNRYESYEGSILRYMLGFDLSSNELTGDVPSEIGYLTKIRAANLSHNSLSGSIPESFSNLKNIESLDLSHNKLSGQIPPQLTELYSLAIFNVSFNNLSGPTPNKGQFATFDESNYGGNPGLCGPQIKRSCGNSEPTTPPATPSDVGEEDESAIDMVSFYWSLFAAYVTTIMGLVLILWLNSYWRRQWFCFIDACIISCYCWILRNVFHRYDDMYMDG